MFTVFSHTQLIPSNPLSWQKSQNEKLIFPSCRDIRKRYLFSPFWHVFTSMVYKKSLSIYFKNQSWSCLIASTHPFPKQLSMSTKFRLFYILFSLFHTMISLNLAINTQGRFGSWQHGSWRFRVGKWRVWREERYTLLQQWGLEHSAFW